MKKGVNWPVSPPMGRQKIMIRLTTKAKTSKAHQVKKTDLWLMSCKNLKP
jgi:hypothetical protein